MKIKHLIGWVIYFALVGSLTMLMGCEETELDRKIQRYQKACPNRDGDCVIYTMKRRAYYEREGIQSRFCHGWYKGENHAWCEYEEDGVWLVDDPAQGNKGYQRWEYVTDGYCDYIWNGV